VLIKSRSITDRSIISSDKTRLSAPRPPISFRTK
jgi:hypothetical protein